MQILIINHYAGSLEFGMEYRPYYFAREWIKMGHTVHIITADYSHLRKMNPNINTDFQVEKIEGINYHWVKTGKYHGNGIKRAITMIKFVSKLYIRAKRLATEIKPDVVIASSTYPLDTFAAQRISKFANSKLIHEIHDMWPLTLIEIGGMSKYNPFVIMMQLAENSFCKHSDTIVSLLPCAKQYLVKHGMHPDAFRYIPNGIVCEDWNDSHEIPIEHKKTFDLLKKDNKFIVGYFGGHAISNALEILLKVAKTITTPDIHFVLVGDGVEKESLQKLARNQNIENVTFLPSVSKLTIPDLLKNFDAIYIGGRSSPLYRFGVCLNKSYDSMMAAKPIIYAMDSPNNDVRDYKCGVVVKPEDIDDIINGILLIYNCNETEVYEMGMRGKKAVLENYEYKILSRKFESILYN